MVNTISMYKAKYILVKRITEFRVKISYGDFWAKSVKWSQ